jgi:RNA polymerase sigma-B factor
MPPSAPPPFSDRPAAPSGSGGPDELQVEHGAHGAGGPPAVRVRGEIDLSTRARLADELDRAVATTSAAGSPAGDRPLVVDLRGVTFADGATVAVLAHAARAAAVAGVHLRLLPGPAVDDVVGRLGAWAELTAGPGRIEVQLEDGPPAPAEPADRRRNGGAAPEYEHLAPLFAERARLPADHPRRPELRVALITGYLPVARNIARRHRHRGERLDDLEQVAMVGLINAVDRFDVDRGTDFLAFAIPTINGEVQRHYRDRSSTIRVPRRIRQLRAQVVRAVEELRRRDGCAPRPSRIASHLGIGTDDVLEALEAAHRSYTPSLDEPFAGDPADAEGSRFATALTTDDHDLGLVDDRESLGPLIEALPARERRILLLRFFGNQTQSEIAAALGISQMHVSRLLATTLAGLRAGLEGT